MRIIWALNGYGVPFEPDDLGCNIETSEEKNEDTGVDVTQTRRPKFSGKLGHVTRILSILSHCQ